MGGRIGEDWYEDWFALLPPDLSERAYRHHGEMAWDRSDALRVVALVERHGYEVSIIEIWLPTRPGPTLSGQFVYDWTDAYDISAATFIETFDWDERDHGMIGEVPYFNISADLIARCAV